MPMTSDGRVPIWPIRASTADLEVATVRFHPIDHSKSSTLPNRRRLRRNGKRRLGRLSLALITLILAFLTAAPFLWMLAGSFKTAAAVYGITLLPAHPTIQNYVYVLTQVPFSRYFLNTFIVAAVVTVIALLFHAMAGYALARMKFPGRDALFIFIYATLLVSLPVILVPLYLIVRYMGILNTYQGLIIPSIFNAFGIFLLRQFYLGIPKELEDAAEVDGCGYWRRFVHVALPLGRPILIALSVFFFLANWNSFLWPLAATQSQHLWLLQEGIASFPGQYSSAWAEILAASTLAAIPTVALFIIFQRQIVSSYKMAGLK